MNTFVRPHRSGEPTVSVIVPAYNAGSTIDAALRSVFAQTFRDLEVIVVDDGSTDDTADRVAAWGDAVVYRWQPNAGPARARNEAIRIARGRLLAFLDADDVWLATKLEHQVAYFERYPETGLLHAEAHLTRAPLATVFEMPEPPSVSMAPPSNDFCRIFHLQQSVKTLTVMAPRQVVMDAGLFDERRELHVEDWDLWLRIAARYPVGFLPVPLAIHRTGGGMSSNVEKTFHGQTLVIDKALPLCASGCPRHREAPDACLQSRQHLLHSQLGYERFWRGQRRSARAAYRQALHACPTDSRARWYVAASYVGRRWLGPVRELRNAMRRLVQPARRTDSTAASPAAPADPLHDTAYRRMRQGAAQMIHTVDDLVSLRGHAPRRVLFEAASPLSLAIFRPIYERLRDDSRIEFWFTANDRTWNAPHIFDHAGITERVLTPDQARWGKFDAYVNTDFWNMTWLPRRTRRLHLFHGVAGKFGLDAPVAIAPVVAAFDRLMFANLDRMRRYAAAGLVDPESKRAALVGYPKVDCLVDGSLDADEIRRSLGLDRDAPTVLYAPTWSPHSSLGADGERIITTLARMGLNVIVKLHDRSLDGSVRGSGGVDWRARLSRLSRTCRVHLADGADASPYLYVADVLVTDHSSVGFEYMLLDRPLIVVDCPDLLRHSLVNPQKAALLRSAAYVIPDGAAIAAAVRTALDAPGMHSERRRTIAAELFYRPGTATSRAVQCLYDVLDLPAHTPAPAAVHSTGRPEGRPLQVPMASLR